VARDRKAGNTRLVKKATRAQAEALGEDSKNQRKISLKNMGRTRSGETTGEGEIHTTKLELRKATPLAAVLATATVEGAAGDNGENKPGYL
jgi:hypothetical protein